MIITKNVKLKISKKNIIHIISKGYDAKLKDIIEIKPEDLNPGSHIIIKVIKKYNPKEITTYVDRSYSQGELYNTLGFTQQEKTIPNYYYIIDNVKQCKFNYRKDILIKDGFDPNKSEHGIMLDRKIYRIYDSGYLKFLFIR